MSKRFRANYRSSGRRGFQSYELWQKNPTTMHDIQTEISLIYLFVFIYSFIYVGRLLFIYMYVWFILIIKSINFLFVSFIVFTMRIEKISSLL